MHNDATVAQGRREQWQRDRKWAAAPYQKLDDFFTANRNCADKNKTRIIEHKSSVTEHMSNVNHALKRKRTGALSLNVYQQMSFIVYHVSLSTSWSFQALLCSCTCQHNSLTTEVYIYIYSRQQKNLPFTKRNGPFLLVTWQWTNCKLKQNGLQNGTDRSVFMPVPLHSVFFNLQFVHCQVTKRNGPFRFVKGKFFCCLLYMYM
jgi:hypothetical protein